VVERYRADHLMAHSLVNPSRSGQANQQFAAAAAS
jgi:hypothetical protein